MKLFSLTVCLLATVLLYIFPVSVMAGFDSYTLDFEGASSVNWVPDHDSSGNLICPPDQTFGTTAPTSQCGYSINDSEITFYFNQSGDGIPEMATLFGDNLFMFQGNGFSSNELLYLGFSFQNIPTIPKELYFFNCGTLNVDNVQVRTCIAQQHNFGHIGHYWVLAAPNEQVFKRQSVEFNYSFKVNYGMNAAILTTCFTTGLNDFGAGNSDSISLQSTSESQGLGTLNCSCLISGDNCDDLDMENQLVKQLNTEALGALKSMSKLVDAASTISEQIANLILYLGQPDADPEAEDDMVGDLIEDVDD
jgi:hypothetical protein